MVLNWEESHLGANEENMIPPGKKLGLLFLFCGVADAWISGYATAASTKPSSKIGVVDGLCKESIKHLHVIISSRSAIWYYMI